MVFDFHEKRRLKGYLYSRTTAVVLLLLAIPLAVSVYGRFVAERKVAAKREETVQELAALKERAAVLEAEVGRLKSERGIEEEIRDRYEVSKVGEKVVVILGDSATDAPSTTATTTKDSEAGGFWSYLWPL